MATGGDGRKTSNGQSVARRVPRTSARCRQTPMNVAAIDFGTANCSLAYAIGCDYDSTPQLLLINGSFNRALTAVLFNTRGVVTHFGKKARERYRNLKDEERPQHAYFEQIKMELQRDESVSRDKKVEALNGTEYYLVDVIAHILKYLKDEFIKMLNNSEYDMKATDFDWVVTVPAIWRDRGKQMMREAGYKAGLCSEDSCTGLKPVPYLTDPPKERHPQKLSLAFEPESAAIYCQSMPKKDLSQHCQASEPFTASSYLIIDIGGGTVDISAHRVVKGMQTYIDVLHRPMGNDYGGARVNTEFANFLQDLLKDKGFKRFLQTGNKIQDVKNKTYLNELINRYFEDQKILFAEPGDDESTADTEQMFLVELPYLFCRTYEEDMQAEIRRRGDTDIQLVDQHLQISYKLMETFFKPIVEHILECIDRTLRGVSEKIEKLYVVGGFGGSPYISKAITKRFSFYEFIIPCEPALAVIRGAVCFLLNPDIVKCRSVDATYGIALSPKFDSQLHDPEYRFLNDDEVPHCNHVFSTVVERDEIVGSNEVFTSTFCPLNHNATSMTLRFYCSREKDVWYTTGRRHKGSRIKLPAEVHKIGEITVEMPDLTGDKERRVDVTFDFSHTEIQVQAFDRQSTKECQAVLDFLTCSSTH